MPVSFPTGDPRRALDSLRLAIIEGCRDACLEACTLTKSLAQRTLTDIGKVDRGITRSSIDYRVETRGDGAVGTVFVGAPWGVWVEFGRRGVRSDPTKDPRAATAAWPPVAAIRAWVARNYRKPSPSGRTRAGRARKPTQEDIDSLTFLIGRKIYLHGIKPAPFLTPAYNRVRKDFPVLVTASIQRRRAAIGRSPA